MYVRVNAPSRTPVCGQNYIKSSSKDLLLLEFRRKKFVHTKEFYHCSTFCLFPVFLVNMEDLRKYSREFFDKLSNYISYPCFFVFVSYGKVRTLTYVHALRHIFASVSTLRRGISFDWEMPAKFSSKSLE